jgi:hypothetical protein
MENKSPSKTGPTRQMPQGSKNEGEGNRTADRQYREGVSRHISSGESEPAADEARRALDGDEADDLREAEQEGKSRAAADDEDEDAGRHTRGQEEDQKARSDQGHRNQRQ